MITIFGLPYCKLLCTAALMSCSSFCAASVGLEEAVVTKVGVAFVAPGCGSGNVCGKIGSADVQMIRLDQERDRKKRLVERRSDQQRWAGRIFSDATRSDDLQMLLVKSTGLTMRLMPKTGVLYFEKAGQSHAFKISAALGEPGAMCPDYNFQVISASERHALIKKNCPAFEYKPGRLEMSSEIILYDAQTATTKSLWASSAGKGEKFPSANPTPTIKVEKNGYLFQWTGTVPNSKSGELVTLNSRYSVIRDPASGKNYLQCRDLRVIKNEQIDSEACEGLILYALPANGK